MCEGVGRRGKVCVCVRRKAVSECVNSESLAWTVLLFFLLNKVASTTRVNVALFLKKAKRLRERREGKRERISDEIFVKERGGRKGTYGERGLNWKLRE